MRNSREKHEIKDGEIRYGEHNEIGGWKEYRWIIKDTGVGGDVKIFFIQKRHTANRSEDEKDQNDGHDGRGRASNVAAKIRRNVVAEVLKALKLRVTQDFPFGFFRTRVLEC